MYKLYTPLFSLLLISCGTKINYLGNTSSPTEKIDVYVDASAIKRPYTIIGKGYPQRLVGEPTNLRKLQNLAVELAKKKGANAILFQDYYITDERTGIYQVTSLDSTGRRLVGMKSSVAPAAGSGRDILFLKYE